MSIYQIKKGEHSSGLHFMPLFNIQEMTALVKFDESCLYVPEQFQGVNKLFGFSEGFNHMQNSVRMGWTSDGTNIHLHYFTHRDGKFTSIDTEEIAPLGRWILLTVRSEHKNLFGYRLYPWFGGQNPAPHDMRIEIKWQ